MMIEQAFLALPEVLHGSGYQRQDYEAGIINALTLSMLQVLNGRNVNNPISCIQSEKMFRKAGQYAGLNYPRYLRADLYVNLYKMFVANNRLSQYGWRHNLWLEGKFRRKGAGNGDSHSGNKTNYVATTLADLIRLAVLVPEEKELSNAGRYFLHVYDAHPQYYLTFRSRNWCKKICEPGDHEVVLENLDKEPESVRTLLGDLGDLKVEVQITNLTAWPLHNENQPVYWCCLTRFNSLKVSMDAHWFEICPDRQRRSSGEDAIQNIVAHVADRLHIRPESLESQPVEEEIEEEVESD